MVLNQEQLDWEWGPLPGGRVLVFLGRVEREMDWQISVVLAVMQMLYWSVVVMTELSVKGHVLINWLIYVPTLSYDRDL